MKRLRATAVTLADRVNPIVIKELRQAVQSRLVNSILLLFLLVNLVVVGGYLMLNDDAATSSTAGRSLFTTLYGVLMVTCLVFVPLYAGIRLALERNDTNIDLLFITTISPAAIIRGKFLAALALAILIYSACMPFIALTYLMRGIDLPSIFFALAAGLAFTAAAIIVAIFFGAIPSGWLLRLLLAGATLFILYYVVQFVIQFGSEVAGRGITNLLGSPDAWVAFAIAAGIGIGFWGLFYLLAVAALSGRTSNRMFPIRVFLTTVWALFGIGLTLWAWSMAAPSYIEPLMIWSVGSVAFFSGVMVFCLAERESWTPRVRRKIPRGGLMRFVAWMYYTGSAGGVTWSVSIVMASLVIGWLGQGIRANRTGYSMPPIYERDELFRGLLYIFGIFLFAWNYSMTGLLARRLLAPKSPPLVGPIVAFALLIMGCIFPYFLAYMVQGSRWKMEALPVALMVFSPTVLSDNFSRTSQDAYIYLILWAAIALVVNLQWFHKQWLAFERHERRTPEPMPAPILVLTPAPPPMALPIPEASIANE